MKKELTLKLTETVGECVIEMEAERGKNGISIRFNLEEDRNGCHSFDLEDYHLGMLAEFFSKAYNEVKKLNE